ncbi:Wzy polymerase domain-containing protein [Variovorax paradoxus]|uniref:PglL family O-oligosaccharyltransferase n=1 Tax=Variovorax paradoxus TaxID=34073 RepID=UPI0021ABA26C|nr:Wzy polymerase domain-containing protein [Variovorax paradoxus]UVH57622.1 Wzy polymerase domain-containing protein [Variovorax paradoxus]
MTSYAAPASSALPASKALDVTRTVLVALPFLCPLVAGPSVNVWQLLVSWVCLAALLLTGPVGWPALAVGGWLGLGGFLVALSGWGALTAWGPACLAIAGIASAASVGSGLARDGQAASSLLAKGVLVAGLVSAVLGLLQYYGLAEPLVPWTTSPALGQAYGNLRQRNQFATLISLAWCAALWLYATSDASRARRGLLAAGGLLLIAAAASTSRTGLLQLLSITGIAAFIARRERQNVPVGSTASYCLPAPKWLLATIPLYFLIAWVLPRLAGGGGGAVESMIERLKTGAPDDHSRLLLWRNVLALISEHPWTGWGWGELAFAHYSTSYSGGRFVEILDNAHNLPLHLAVELGIPAAVLICGGFLWLILSARPWHERDPVRLMGWGMLWAIVLHSLLEYPLWYGPFQLIFGLCIGLLWPSRSARSVAKAAPFAAAALLGIAGYAGWDYVRISQIYLPREERLAQYEDNTLAKIRSSRFFANQVQFAELTLTTVTRANAGAVHELARRIMHFSPEPRVIVKLIESAELLGLEDEARAQAERFRDAFPSDFARWMREDADEGAAR